ncbi:MAG: Maf family protein, partial [Gemmatimonadota bacterium]|nr:Maf family protein [Gemmatimonadota bacterium]
VAMSRPDALVVGSDTIVVLAGEVLGKPSDAEDAVRMLRRLAGEEHEVFTGIAVSHRGHVGSGVERVRVRIRRLGAGEAEAYAATGEPLDKAGAYGIQGYGSALVEWIEGDFFAVMGLPVVRMLRIIERFGWRYAFGRLERVEDTESAEAGSEGAFATPREYIRHTANVPIEVRAVPGAPAQTRSGVNVSVGGLSFVSEEYLEPGRTIDLKISAVEPPFEAHARVVWCRPEEDEYCVGAQFLDANDAFRARMVEQVCTIERYRQEVLEQEGRTLTTEAAATEWIGKFANRFPG